MRKLPTARGWKRTRSRYGRSVTECERNRGWAWACARASLSRGSMLERASNLAESRKVWEIDVCDYESGSRVERVGIEGDTIANKTAMEKFRYRRYSASVLRIGNAPKTVQRWQSLFVGLFRREATSNSNPSRTKSSVYLRQQGSILVTD